MAAEHVNIGHPNPGRPNDHRGSRPYRSERAALLGDSGVRFTIATLAIALATPVVDIADGHAHLERAFVAVAVVAGLAGVGLSVPISAALGGIAWAFTSGFVENGLGRLSVGSADLVRLALAVVVAEAVSWIGAVVVRAIAAWAPPPVSDPIRTMPARSTHPSSSYR